MQALAALLLLAAACGPSRPPSAVASRARPERWHLLALPEPDGRESTVVDLLVANDDIWIANDRGTISRLEPDGHRTEVSQIETETTFRLLPHPTGFAAVTGVQGGEGVRVTLFDRAGRIQGRPTGPIDLWPGTLFPLYAAARPAGGIALLGQRGYSRSDTGRQREVCVLVELDARGTLVRRTELAGGDRCFPAGVAVVDADLIIAVTSYSALPALGVTTDPATSIGVIARLGSDGKVKWHRTLEIRDAAVQLSDLASAGGVIAAVGIIEQDWGNAGYRIDFAPSPRSVPGSEYGRQSRQRVVAVGLDPVTGASRWLKLIEGRGELAFIAYQIRGASTDEQVAIAIQPMNTGAIGDEPMHESDVYVAALDGATGTTRWTQRAKADQRGSEDGIELGRVVASPGAAVHLVGGFRRSLAIGDAKIKGRFEADDPCKGGARSLGPSDDRTLFSIPLLDPCRVEFVEPLTGFVARITR